MFGFKPSPRINELPDKYHALETRETRPKLQCKLSLIPARILCPSVKKQVSNNTQRRHSESVKFRRVACSKPSPRDRNSSLDRIAYRQPLYVNKRRRRRREWKKVIREEKFSLLDPDKAVDRALGPRTGSHRRFYCTLPFSLSSLSCALPLESRCRKRALAFDRGYRSRRAIS
jgi:hypothetical protein